MTILDEVIDAFEEAVSRQGVATLDVGQFVPQEFPGEGQEQSHSSKSRIIVELLRVWLEYRWKAGLPASVDDGLAYFPNDTFSDRELDELLFEEQRQRDRAKQGTLKKDAFTPKLDRLPCVGECWGPFRLVSVLGEGAFARVYLAKQLDMAERMVALKLTFRETGEAHWLAKLQHSAIVPIYSVHQLDGIFGICMPFLGNTTLADLLREMASAGFETVAKSKHRHSVAGTTLLSTLRARQSLLETRDANDSPLSVTSETAAQQGLVSKGEPWESPDRSVVAKDRSMASEAAMDRAPAAVQLAKCDYQGAVVWIGMQLADALAYAHSQGILHSDIKPANILLASDGQPRLIDFNVAVEELQGNGDESKPVGTNEEVRRGHRVPVGGTIAYMAPEHRQAIQQQETIDDRSDIYSLGAVLFEALAGSLYSRAVRQKRGGPVSVSQLLRELNPAVTPAVAGIIAKCMQPDPANRYASARQLCDDLTAQTKNQPLVHLKEPSLGERSQKWMRRHPRLTSTASVGLLATVGFGLLASLVWWRGEQLQNAEWQVHLHQLQKQVPVASAFLSAKVFAPQLEQEAQREMVKTLSLLQEKPLTPDGVAKRMVTIEGREAADRLNRDIENFLYLAHSSVWNVPDAKEVDQTALQSMRTRWSQAAVTQPEVGDGKSATRYRDALESMAKGDFGTAKGHLEKVAESSQTDFMQEWLLGEASFALGDYEKAVECFSACIAVRPEIGIGYFSRGMVRLAMNRVGLAEADYRLASEKSPSQSWAKFNQAIALQQQGRIIEALAAINEVVDSGLESVSVYRLRSELHAQLGQVEQQVADLARAQEVEPVCDQDYVDRGLIRLGMDPKLAAEDFEKALAWNPRSIDARQKLAYVYSEVLGEPQKAMAMLEELIRYAPEQTTHRAGRAVVYARRGDRQLAEADLMVCDQQSPKEPLVIYQVACAHALLASAMEKESLANPGTEPENSAFRIHQRKAEQGLARALSGDETLAAIVATDPDMEWLREKPNYATIMEAAKIASSILDSERGNSP